MAERKRTASNIGRKKSQQKRSYRSNKHEKHVDEIPCSVQTRFDTFNKKFMFNDEPIAYLPTAPEHLIPLELRPSINERDPSTSNKLATRYEKKSKSINNTNNNKNNGQILIQSKQQLAQFGFYYTPLSIKHKYSITCSSCNQIIRDPIPQKTDIVKYHLTENPSCPFSLIWDFKNKWLSSNANNNNSNTADWKSDKVFGDVESEAGISLRRQTFTHWSYDFPDIETMVTSGLYYDPLNDIEPNKGDDRVSCMYCGLNLEQWERDDDVLSAHKNANPECWIFNYNKVQDEEIAYHEMQTIEHNSNNDELPEFNAPMDDQMKFDLSDRENEKDKENDEDQHSILSITTTTTALPVEIIDQDEIEEYLSNSKRQLDTENNNNNNSKMVDIPSIKSSDLSQFFTELDAESEGEIGASYFNSNRKKRREREKEQIDKLMSNVDPIVEEESIEVVENNYNNSDNNNNNNNNDSDNDSDNGYDIPIYENDDFNANTTNIPQSREKNDVGTGEPGENDKVENDNKDQINGNDKDKNVEDIPDLEPMQNDIPDFEPIENVYNSEFIDNVAPELTVTQNNAQNEEPNISKSNIESVQVVDKEMAGVNNDSCEPPTNDEAKVIESKGVEITRVEQLESEIQFLKTQIEALQNSQKVNEIRENVDETIHTSIRDTYYDENDKKINGNIPEKLISNEITVKTREDDQNYTSERENENEALKAALTTNIEIKKEHSEKNNVDNDQDNGVAKSTKKSTKKKKSNRSKRKRLDESDDEDQNENDDALDILSGVPSKKRKTKSKSKSKSKVRNIKIEQNDNNLIEDEPQSSSPLPNDEEVRYSNDIENKNEIENAMEIDAEKDVEVKRDQVHTHVKENTVSSKSIKEDVDPISKELFEKSAVEPVNVSLERIEPVEKSIDEVNELINSTINMRKDTSEIATQIDPTPKIFSDDEILVDNIVLPNSEPNIEVNNGHKEHTELDVYDGHKQHSDHNTNNDRHEPSPTLMRKNARASSVNRSSSGDLKTSYETLDKLMNQERFKSHADHEKKKKDTQEDGNKERAAEKELEKNNMLDENRFTIGSDILNNQSTPYTEDFKNLENMKFTKGNGIPQLDEHIAQSSPKEDANKTKLLWTPIDSGKYKEFYKDIHEATGYVKEVLDSPYELLGEDLDGLLTEFVSAIPGDQLKMTVREWLMCQQEQAVGLVLDKAEEMMQQFRADQKRALSFLRRLPEKD